MNTQKMTSIPEFWNETLADELMRFLTSKLKCPHLAAEFTHDTYLSLRQVIEKNQLENIRAMAFRIAINLVIDHQRKSKVRDRHAGDEEFEAVLETNTATVLPPEQILISQERYKLLQAALLELSADCRTVFIMHSLQGKTYAEIAAIMGISKSLVNKLLAQAMRLCADKLAEKN